MDNCYELSSEADRESDRDSDRARRCREFEPPAFDVWLERLSAQGFCQVLVSLVLKLERMTKAPLPGPRLLANLRRLTVLMRDVADDLPRSRRPRTAPGGRLDRLSLEQRLCCVTFKNLKRTLGLLDRTGRGGSDQDAARVWLVGEMFSCLGRQIELGALWGQPWPPHTWQELHELFSYRTNRMAVAARRVAMDSGGVHQHLDLETAYKRLLILGLCAEQQADALLDPDQVPRLAGWTRESELRDPSAYSGVLGTYLVQVSGDTPPRLVPGALGSTSRDWVLHLSPAFLAVLASAKTRGGTAVTSERAARG